MRQEELYNIVKKEIKTIKNKVELNNFNKEKDNLLKEYNSIKEEIKNIKNNNKSNILETQSYRNKNLQINSILEKYNKQEEKTEEDQQKLKIINEEKDQVEKWFKNQKEIKNSTNNNLLSLLSKQEKILLKLIKIDSKIKKFKEKHPKIEETINPKKTIETINKYESDYKTEKFDEDKFNLLKEQYYNEQLIVSTMIETVESKIEKDPISIWNEVLEVINKMNIKHQFIDEIEEEHVEDNIELSNNNDNKEINIDLNSMIIDITKDEIARESIKNTNIEVNRIKKEIEKNNIETNEGIKEFEEKIKNENTCIFSILNNYREIKSKIEKIIIDNDKRNELTKIALGKTKELKFISSEEIENINKINKDDYIRLIIEFINLKQYETTINELKNNIKNK